jgi:hypothetical protein
MPMKKEEGPVKRPRFSNKLPLVALIVLVAFFSFVTAPAWSQQSSSDTAQGTASGVGMQVTSFFASLCYAPLKIAFAIGGGIVGGLAYAFSGGNETTAKSIWIPSVYGTYLITPEHLAGDKPVRFLGAAAESNEGRTDPTPLGNPAPEPAR